MPINFLKLVFDDATVKPAQQLLADGELSVYETYETEYSLLRQPVLSWQNLDDFNSLNPGEVFTVIVSCFGKTDW